MIKKFINRKGQTRIYYDGLLHLLRTLDQLVNISVAISISEDDRVMI